MLQTTTPEAVATGISHFERFTARIIHLLSFVPDDKLNWSPSKTSKSTLQIVAHCAVVNRFFAQVISESMPNPLLSPPVFFAGIAADEAKVTTREAALALLNQTAAELKAALEGVSQDRLETNPTSPFGPLPMRFWITQGGDHTADHAGQIGYLQTTWGDLDNHFG